MLQSRQFVKIVKDEKKNKMGVWSADVESTQLSVGVGATFLLVDRSAGC